MIFCRFGNFGALGATSAAGFGERPDGPRFMNCESQRALASPGKLKRHGPACPLLEAFAGSLVARVFAICRESLNKERKKERVVASVSGERRAVRLGSDATACVSGERQLV